MSHIITPSWADFDELVRCAKRTLLICTPYYSGEGIGRLFDGLNSTSRFRFWTRLSPSDWAAGVADPSELSELLELVRDSGSEVELGINQRLHAKAYAADDQLALIGSANLSGGGFEANLELMIRFRGGEAEAAVDDIHRLCQPSMRALSLEDLRAWVGEYSGIVGQARAVEDNEADVLAPAQAALDRMLGFGQSPRSALPELSLQDLGDFIDWLRENPELPGARTIVAQWDNTDGNNRMGHVKQSFFGSTRFLSDYAQLREHLSHELADLSSNDIYQLQRDPAVASPWIQHLDEHAMDTGRDFSYPTLRTILPPQLGGTRLGGGGGSGTIKRVLPLVACYESEQNQ